MHAYVPTHINSLTKTRQVSSNFLHQNYKQPSELTSTWSSWCILYLNVMKSLCLPAYLRNLNEFCTAKPGLGVHYLSKQQRYTIWPALVQTRLLPAWALTWGLCIFMSATNERWLAETASPEIVRQSLAIRLWIIHKTGTFPCSRNVGTETDWGHGWINEIK